MKIKLTRPFSGLKSDKWRNLLNFGVVVFYIIMVFSIFFHGSVSGDYVQYWMAGKIADQKGYSEVYNLSELRRVQQQFIIESGNAEKEDISSLLPLPLGYFPVFIIPFQFLSRISVESGYIIWTLLNLALLISYLIFFLRKTTPEDKTDTLDLKLLIPFFLSHAVFSNISMGQVEVFVLICAGEFIRQTANKKSTLSGLWLGGLLLKPPLLILIIPIFIMMRYWKVLLGFFASSGIILGTSLLLSDLDGMGALINIWTKVTGAAAPSRPDLMSNWRMVGVNMDQLFKASFGWVIVSLGIILTIIVVIYLIRRIPPYGSPFWMMTILGVFTATLAITWHSHYHMAMVMIPFLIYALDHKLLPEKYILSWSYITPLVFLGTLLFEIIIFALIGGNPEIIHMKILGFTGLILNMVILFSVLQAVKVRSLINN